MWVAENRNLIRDQHHICELFRWVRSILQDNFRSQVDTERKSIESLLASDPPLVREVRIRIRGYYQEVAYRPPPPARITISRMTSDRVALTPPLSDDTLFRSSVSSLTQMWCWSLIRFRFSATHMSTTCNVSSNIHTFLRRSFRGGRGISYCGSENMQYCGRVWMGEWRRDLRRCPRYCTLYICTAPWRHARTMKWLVLCLRSQMDMLWNRQWSIPKM